MAGALVLDVWAAVLVPVPHAAKPSAAAPARMLPWSPTLMSVPSPLLLTRAPGRYREKVAKASWRSHQGCTPVIG